MKQEVKIRIGKKKIEEEEKENKRDSKKEKEYGRS